MEIDIGDASKYMLELCKITYVYGLFSSIAERGSVCGNGATPTSYSQTLYDIADLELVVTMGSILSSVSILFENSSRRNEITYFVCAKAIRSGYVRVKRMLAGSWGGESSWMHILLMGALYYLYNHQH